MTCRFKPPSISALAMRSLALAVVFSCALAACDTATTPGLTLTAETARASYEFGDDVEVSISNRTDGDASLLFFCGSVLERREVNEWVAVLTPDCSRVFEIMTEVGAGATYVGVLTLPSDETLEIGAVYRFRFTGVQRSGSGNDALVTNSFEVIPTF